MATLYLKDDLDVEKVSLYHISKELVLKKNGFFIVVAADGTETKGTYLPVGT